jgi:hypothetical protein
MCPAGGANLRQLKRLPSGARFVALEDAFFLQAYAHGQSINGGLSNAAVFYLFRGDFALQRSDAQHAKALPGRKTGVLDAGWLPICCNTVCAAPVSSRPPTIANGANSRGISPV